MTMNNSMNNKVG